MSLPGRSLLFTSLLVGALLPAVALLPACRPAASMRATTPTQADALPAGQALPGRRALARDLYLAGVPLLARYQALYARSLDTQNPAYVGPLNALHWQAHGSLVADTYIPVANLDLRAEPMVLEVPALPVGRYYALQLIDLHATAIAHIGSRTTGNLGGRYLIAGPGWRGDVPTGITEVLRADTQLVTLSGWLQRSQADTRRTAQQVQAGYRVLPLSQLLGTHTVSAAPAVHWPRPLPPELARRSPVFFAQLEFLLQFAPPQTPGLDLRPLLRRLEISDATLSWSTARTIALRDGMADGQREIDQRRSAMRGDGSHDDAVARAGRAQRGEPLDGDDALFPRYDTDADGTPLDGRRYRYTLRFARDQLPPVHGFWSLGVTPTGAQQRATAAAQVTSAALPHLRRDPDGGITLYLQHAPPPPEQRSNWIPAPDGPFLAAAGYYWPKAELLDARWALPPIQRRL